MDDFSVKYKKTNWNSFEHFLWRELQQLPFAQLSKTKSSDISTVNNIPNNEQVPHFLLALSGGADSVALFKALIAIQASAKIKISAMYVHHGDSLDAELNSYRSSCEIFCRKLCADNKVNFLVSERPSLYLKSEEAFRDFRYQQLYTQQDKIGAKILVMAHHRDDLLETRLLRLIRGTGADGLVSMKTWQSVSINENQMTFIWRPLLKTSKQDLLLYLNKIAIGYIDDPSNASSDYMRNWLRNEWLPQLEQKATGSVNSLARSLEILVENIQEYQSIESSILPIQSIKMSDNNEESEQTKKKYFISRVDLLALSLNKRQQCVVKLLKRASVNKISFGQVNEILKQLDNPQKMHKFAIGNCVWVVDAERIYVESK